MKILLDTNIIGMMRAGKQVSLPAGDLHTSSVVLHELFLTQQPDEAGFRYALPMPNSKHPLPGLLHPIKSKPIPNSADRLLLDFNNEMPSRIEYGHLSASRILGRPAGRTTLSVFAKVLGRTRRRIVLENYDFLIKRGVEAIALNSTLAQGGLDLYKSFTEHWNPKTNIRNTLNDLFILSSAIESNSILVSDDKLLLRFASEVAPRTLEARNDYFISTPEPSKGEQRNRGSKGYVNSQWRAKVF